MLVTVVIIFQTPSFIQAFAESQAVTEMLSYFKNWSNEAKRAVEEDLITTALLANEGEGALSRITAMVRGDRDKPSSRLSSCGDLQSLTAVYVSHTGGKSEVCVFEETATASTSSNSSQSSNNGDNSHTSYETSSISVVFTKRVADGWFALVARMRRLYQERVEQVWELLGLDGGPREKLFAFDCHHRCRT